MLYRCSLDGPVRHSFGDFYVFCHRNYFENPSGPTRRPGTLSTTDPGTLPSGFDNEWRLQAESAFDLLGDDGDDGDADGDVVVD